MKLFIATRNRHKIREIRAVFSAPDIELVDMTAYPSLPEVVEDGDTFEANAIKKASEMARATGLWAMADDSGLEVSALGNEPGVFSARYAGEPVDYKANNRKLLDALKNCSDRRARFRCVLALADSSGSVRTVEGRCEGMIIDEERGGEGFGYDPIFVPDGYQETFSEMDPTEKNRISHRGRALAAAMKEWGRLLSRNA